MVSRETIQLCSNNNPKGHEHLYKATIAYVFSTIKRYIFNAEEQKDLVQETYAKVFQNIKSFDETKGEFKFWIRKIAVNECLMFLRKQKNRIQMVSNEINDDIVGAQDISYDTLTRNDILKLLKKMPRNYQLVFMLNTIDGYEHKEIALLLGIEESTSRSQLLRAKKWLKKQFASPTNQL